MHVTKNLSSTQKSMNHFWLWKKYFAMWIKSFFPQSENIRWVQWKYEVTQLVVICQWNLLILLKCKKARNMAMFSFQDRQLKLLLTETGYTALYKIVLCHTVHSIQSSCVHRQSVYQTVMGTQSVYYTQSWIYSFVYTCNL